MHKRILFILSLLIITSMLLTACGGTATDTPEPEEPAMEEPVEEEPMDEPEETVRSTAIASTAFYLVYCFYRVNENSNFLSKLWILSIVSMGYARKLLADNTKQLI